MQYRLALEPNRFSSSWGGGMLRLWESTGLGLWEREQGQRERESQKRGATFGLPGLFLLGMGQCHITSSVAACFIRWSYPLVDAFPASPGQNQAQGLMRPTGVCAGSSGCLSQLVIVPSKFFCEFCEQRCPWRMLR